MKAIRTRYRGVSRTYVATDGDGNRVVIPEPDRTANTRDAHRAAAVALIRRMDWEPAVIASGWSHAGEWVHVMLTRRPGTNDDTKRLDAIEAHGWHVVHGPTELRSISVVTQGEGAKVLTAPTIREAIDAAITQQEAR